VSGTPRDGDELVALLEENPNPVLRVGGDRRVFFANRAARRAPGLLEPEGDAVSSELALALKELSSARDAQTFELELPSAAFAFSAVPVSSGAALDLFGNDITEQRRVARQFEEQSQMIGSVLRNAGQGIGAFDAEGRLLVWNEEYQKVLRLPDALLVPGRDLTEIATFIAERGDYGAGDPATLARERVDALMSGRTIRAELRIEGGQIYDVIAQPSDTGGFVATYSNVTERKRELEQLEHQQKLIMEMSSPVTQVWKGILLLPVVGIVDAKRADDIMNTALAQIAETRSHIFVLDIGGVAVVDSTVANHLVKVAKATALMGCECVISGVSAAVAQTIVELGVDVTSAVTTANLEEAILHGFRRLGIALGRDAMQAKSEPRPVRSRRS